MINFRDEQKDILNYTEGIMAIPSVPGSGKTFILTHLSLKLYKNLEPDKKILLLTYMNSAVENFYFRIKSLDKNTPNIHIKTIHKFSLDFIKENIDLLNISKDFTLIDNTAFTKLTNNLYKIWFLENRENFSIFFKNGIYNQQFQDDFYINLKSTIQKTISGAKNYGLSWEDMLNLSKDFPKNSLMSLSASFYSLYQAKLKELNYLDYDDLLYYTYKLLKNNENLRTYYQNVYQYILEDESQDSNILQNKIVRLISNTNLVKVGDSNQNITGTFTFSSPKIFRNFCKNATIKKELKNSGRNSLEILTLANYLIKYTNLNHPCLEARKALKRPFIVQAPDSSTSLIKLPNSGLKSFYAADFYQELLLCVSKIKKFNNKYPEKTIGVLCPRNKQLYELGVLLKKEEIDYEILSDLNENNLHTYKKLSDLISFIDKPDNVQFFLKILEDYLIKETLSHEFKEFVYKNGVEKIFEENLEVKYINALSKLSKLLNFSLNTKEKVLIYISQNFEFDFFEQELIENISLNLKSIFKLNPKWSYADLIRELRQVENNKLNYFNWGVHKHRHSYKKTVLSTYHKSKGREWDMVYLLGVNENNFPVFLHKEQQGEKFYLDESYSILEAKALYELEKLIRGDFYKNPILQYKISRIEESLRLLFVGITRAKEYLIISSNEEEQGLFYYKLFSNLIKKLNKN